MLPDRENLKVVLNKVKPKKYAALGKTVMPNEPLSIQDRTTVTAYLSYLEAKLVKAGSDPALRAEFGKHEKNLTNFYNYFKVREGNSGAQNDVLLNKVAQIQNKLQILNENKVGVTESKEVKSPLPEVYSETKREGKLEVKPSMPDGKSESKREIKHEKSQPEISSDRANSSIFTRLIAHFQKTDKELAEIKTQKAAKEAELIQTEKAYTEIVFGKGERAGGRISDREQIEEKHLTFLKDNCANKYKKAVKAHEKLKDNLDSHPEKDHTAQISECKSLLEDALKSYDGIHRIHTIAPRLRDSELGAIASKMQEMFRTDNTDLSSRYSEVSKLIKPAITSTAVKPKLPEPENVTDQVASRAGRRKI